MADAAFDRSPVFAPGRHVGDEPSVPGAVRARQHDRVVDARMLAEGRFDFAQLDPKAANLHLIVDAA
jgi:hypothetical protein